jgi:CTP synthase (UTP-ammonia lyase)
VDSAGEVRIVELDGHPFYVATLFQPELAEPTEVPHPLIKEFVREAANGGKVRLPQESNTRIRFADL